MSTLFCTDSPVIPGYNTIQRNEQQPDGLAKPVNRSTLRKAATLRQDSQKPLLESQETSSLSNSNELLYDHIVEEYERPVSASADNEDPIAYAMYVSSTSGMCSTVVPSVFTAL